MTFKTIDDAIEFLSEGKQNGDTRAMRTMVFDMSQSHPAHEVVSAIFESLVQFKEEPGEGGDMVVEPGHYEAVVVVHLRKSEPTAPVSGGGPSGFKN